MVNVLLQCTPTPTPTLPHPYTRFSYTVCNGECSTAMRNYTHTHTRTPTPTLAHPYTHTFLTHAPWCRSCTGTLSALHVPACAGPLLGWEEVEGQVAPAVCVCVRVYMRASVVVVCVCCVCVCVCLSVSVHVCVCECV
jgi:hypothetical protein